MPFYRFGEWLPDQPDYRNPGLLQAQNVFAAASDYRPVGTLTAVTTALNNRPRGAFQARDTSGNIYQYAADKTKLYQNIDGTWTDRSKTGDYTAISEGRWEFTVWKDKIIATNFGDYPQSLTFGGDQFSDLTTAFNAKHVAVVRDFVVFANTFDASEGNVPDRVRWSAFNDETDYTVSASTLSDYQDLKTAAVERIFGGQYSVIFQKNSVVRMTFVGAPVVFQFDEVLPGIGLLAEGAAARLGDTIYFLSGKGFFALEAGARARPIGAGKVDRYVLDAIDETKLHRVSAAADPRTQRIFWSYVETTSNNPNKVIVYNAAFDRWSLLDERVELLWEAGTTDTTVDSLVGISVDDLNVSIDSSRWIGGEPSIAAFNGDFKSGFFDGVNMTALIETGEVEFNDGGRARVNGFRALVDGGTVTAEVGSRSDQSASASYGSTLSVHADNRFTTRVNDRYHRFRFNLSGAWTNAVGMQIDKTDLRKAGNRG